MHRKLSLALFMTLVLAIAVPFATAVPAQGGGAGLAQIRESDVPALIDQFATKLGDGELMLDPLDPTPWSSFSLDPTDVLTPIEDVTFGQFAFPFVEPSSWADDYRGLSDHPVFADFPNFPPEALQPEALWPNAAEPNDGITVHAFGLPPDAFESPLCERQLRLTAAADDGGTTWDARDTAPGDYFDGTSVQVSISVRCDGQLSASVDVVSETGFLNTFIPAVPIARIGDHVIIVTPFNLFPANPFGRAVMFLGPLAGESPTAENSYYLSTSPAGEIGVVPQKGQMYLVQCGWVEAGGEAPPGEELEIDPGDISTGRIDDGFEGTPESPETDVSGGSDGSSSTTVVVVIVIAGFVVATVTIVLRRRGQSNDDGAPATPGGPTATRPPRASRPRNPADPVFEAGRGDAIIDRSRIVQVAGDGPVEPTAEKVTEIARVVLIDADTAEPIDVPEVEEFQQYPAYTALVDVMYDVGLIADPDDRLALVGSGLMLRPHGWIASPCEVWRERCRQAQIESARANARQAEADRDHADAKADADAEIQSIDEDIAKIDDFLETAERVGDSIETDEERVEEVDRHLYEEYVDAQRAVWRAAQGATRDPAASRRFEAELRDADSPSARAERRKDLPDKIRKAKAKKAELEAAKAKAAAAVTAFADRAAEAARLARLAADHAARVCAKADEVCGNEVAQNERAAEIDEKWRDDQKAKGKAADDEAEERKAAWKAEEDAASEDGGGAGEGTGAGGAGGGGGGSDDDDATEPELPGYMTEAPCRNGERQEIFRARSATLKFVRRDQLGDIRFDKHTDGIEAWLTSTDADSFDSFDGWPDWAGPAVESIGRATIQDVLDIDGRTTHEMLDTIPENSLRLSAAITVTATWPLWQARFACLDRWVCRDGRYVFVETTCEMVPGTDRLLGPSRPITVELTDKTHGAFIDEFQRRANSWLLDDRSDGHATTKEEFCASCAPPPKPA